MPDMTTLSQGVKANASQKAKTATNILDKIRYKFMARSGASGIKMVSRRFRIMDDDRNKRLDWEEFITGMHDAGVGRSNQWDKDEDDIPITDGELKQLFKAFDRDGSGTIDFDEFLIKLQPPMNPFRRLTIMNAFAKMDKDGSGEITVKDLAGTYDVRHHKKFKSGEWTTEQCLKEFLTTFEAQHNVDGKVQLIEFTGYYASISCSIDDDEYFAHVMAKSWGDDVVPSQAEVQDFIRQSKKREEAAAMNRGRKH